MLELSLNSLALESWKAFSECGGINRQYGSERVEVRSLNRATRSQTKGDIVHQSTVTPSTNMIKLWNILPVHIRRERNLRIAKRKLASFAAEKAALFL